MSLCYLVGLRTHGHKEYRSLLHFIPFLVSLFQAQEPTFWGLKGTWKSPIQAPECGKVLNTPTPSADGSVAPTRHFKLGVGGEMKGALGPRWRQLRQSYTADFQLSCIADCSLLQYFTNRKEGLAQEFWRVRWGGVTQLASLFWG